MARLPTEWPSEASAVALDESLPAVAQRSVLTRNDIFDAVRAELRSFATDQLREELGQMANRLRQSVQEDCLKVCRMAEASKPLPLWANGDKVQMTDGGVPELPCPVLLPGSLDEPQAGPQGPVLLPGSLEERYNLYGMKAFAEPEQPVTEPLSPTGTNGGGDTPLPHKQQSERSGLQSSTSSSMSPSSKRKNMTLGNHRDQGLGTSMNQRTSLRGNSFIEHSSLRQQALIVVNHSTFDVLVAMMILLNGVVVGLQTDHMARNKTDEQPTSFQIIELIFCVIFTIELVIRLYAFRWKFFLTPGARGWNLFDLTVVTLQLIEIVVSAVADGIGISFNLMRTLRLIRVIRLARTLRLIGELRTIVSSIAGSMKPLFWTGVLLFMVVYVLGVYVTQVVLHKRMTLQEENKPLPDDLDKYWGNLIKSVFSLFQSITGGIDWDDVTRPLINDIGPELGFLYVLYITFTVLAMLNVVTGVFIQSVIFNAKCENEERTKLHVQQLFTALDVEDVGEITWEEFEAQIERKEMREFFKTIDVDISHAKNLFELLDVDHSGAVDSAEFVDGCLKIWAPSQGLDKLMILRDVNHIRAIVENVLPGISDATIAALDDTNRDRNQANHARRHSF